MSKALQWPYHPLPGKQTQMWKAMGPKSDYKFIGFGGGRGSGKCLSSNELVELRSGSYKKIKNIQRGDRVLSFDEAGNIQPKVVTDVFTSSKKPFYKITTESGRGVSAANTHKLKGIGGWVQCDRLCAGDFIAVSVSAPNEVDNSKLISKYDHDIYWDKIKSIERLPDQKGYDFEVEGNHNYIANGIISHNSMGMRSWFVTACWRWPIKATIIRKSRADLRDNHINPFKAEMRDYIDTDYIKFNERDAAAYFKNGSILKFGYCNKPEDLENIQGQAYDLMGIEESTQLDELYLRKMFAACRGSEISDGTYSNKVLMTFNWGAVSHEYHRRIYWDEEYNEYERPKKFHFIWANVDDNPALLAKTPDYKEQLAATLDEQYRRAWIDGDPDAFTGTVFPITDIAHMVDPEDPEVLGRFNGIVPNNWKMFGSVDVGTTVCAFGLYAKTPGGNLFKMFSYYGEDRNPQDHVEAIVDRIRNYRHTDGRFPSYVLADRRAFAKIGRNQIHSYDTTWEDLFREYGIYLRRANDNREQGFMALKGALGYKYDDSKHEILAHPKLRFFKGTNETTINHLKAMQLSDNNKEDIDKNLPDHDYDETRYANMGALTPSEQKKQEQKQQTDPGSDYGRHQEDHDLLKKGVGLGSSSSSSGSGWESWFD